MSQEINNREYRKEVIKGLLEKLHAGQTVEEVKGEFDAAFTGVSASEISAAEQALINEGVPVEEVQRLCDVHAAVFRDSVDDAQTLNVEAQSEGHPVQVFTAEIKALEKSIADEIRPAIAKHSQNENTADLLPHIEKLAGIENHYSRKENLFFPHMERHGITAPPKVMWAVDDEIRAMIKETRVLAQANDPQTAARLEETLNKIDEMSYKEEQILLPMLLENLKHDEWVSIAEESDELGYFLHTPQQKWQPSEGQAPKAPVTPDNGAIQLPTGFFSNIELTQVLNSLPLDMTFVGADDTVRYFSQGTERVFPRTKAIIGREVSNCHPPASVHIVEGIVNDFKSGKKKQEDFWIQMGEKLILIRYFAVHSEEGEYLGVLEVTQDIAPLKAITGEKRLVDKA